MKKYYSCYNNGVTAIVSEEVMCGIEKRNRIQETFRKGDFDVPYEQRFREKTTYEALQHLEKPIFTFASKGRSVEQPWFTGSLEMFESLQRHIEADGGWIEQGWFFVPFSNGMEVGLHGPDAMRRELAYVTTDRQFRETFGISITELQAELNDHHMFNPAERREAARTMVSEWRRRADADAEAEGES